MEINDVDTLSATIMRGNPGWMIGLGAQFEGDAEESEIGQPELFGMPTDKSLVETEIMLTAWLAGRGFGLSSRWYTHEYSGGGGSVAETRAEFVRK